VAWWNKAKTYLLVALLFALAAFLFVCLDRRKAKKFIGLARGAPLEAEVRALRAELARQLDEDTEATKALEDKITRRQKDLEAVWTEAALPAVDIAARMRKLHL